MRLLFTIVWNVNTQFLSVSAHFKVQIPGCFLRGVGI